MSTVDVLAIAPHPDDAEIFCGGTLLALQGFGYKTGILDLTAGELSSRGNQETRKAETDIASQILKLSYRDCLALPDGFLGTSGKSSLEDQVSSLVRKLRELRPETLLAPYWHDRHPDHEAGSALVSRAIFCSALSNYLTDGTSAWNTPYVLYYQLRQSFTPSFVVDITAVHSRKMEAIMAYRTQVTEQDEKVGPRTLLSDPLSLESMRTRDKYYGAMIGTEFAEPFFSKAALHIADPVAHFRANGPKKSFIFPERNH